ncbi:hypothetical protein GYMLUDRAFT_40483 [Collybiopsis luxurians FD-317 M1]|uniref:Uncharacterized protein n=1 Tax=Collybiopsis luxurians FD-317 M1 TaxID=944289 RepID=A0A0D0CM81_9AGAR|nr:hypothetical protein GYMLUDRAFT_40483 [Collybiopsis luxurians FD-317 M1]
MSDTVSQRKKDLRTRKYFDKELRSLRSAISGWVGRVKGRHTLSDDQLQPLERLEQSLDEYESSLQDIVSPEDESSEEDCGTSDLSADEEDLVPDFAGHDSTNAAEAAKDQTAEDTGSSVLLKSHSENDKEEIGKPEGPVNEGQSRARLRPTSIRVRELINPGAPVPQPLTLIDGQTKQSLQQITQVAVADGNTIPTQATPFEQISTPAWSLTWAQTDSDPPPEMIVQFTPDGDSGDSGPDLQAARFPADGGISAKGIHAGAVQPAVGLNSNNQREGEESSVVLFSEEPEEDNDSSTATASAHAGASDGTGSDSGTVANTALATTGTSRSLASSGDAGPSTSGINTLATRLHAPLTPSTGPSTSTAAGPSTASHTSGTSGSSNSTTAPAGRVRPLSAVARLPAFYGELPTPAPVPPSTSVPTPASAPAGRARPLSAVARLPAFYGELPAPAPVSAPTLVPTPASAPVGRVRPLSAVARLPAFYGESYISRVRIAWKPEYGPYRGQTDIPIWIDGGYRHTWEPLGSNGLPAAPRLPPPILDPFGSSGNSSSQASSSSSSPSSSRSGGSSALKRKHSTSLGADAASAGSSKLARRSSLSPSPKSISSPGAEDEAIPSEGESGKGKGKGKAKAVERSPKHGKARDMDAGRSHREIHVGPEGTMRVAWRTDDPQTPHSARNSASSSARRSARLVSSAEASSSQSSPISDSSASVGSPVPETSSPTRVLRKRVRESVDGEGDGEEMVRESQRKLRRRK